jgi:hypothetical protein
VANSVLRMVAVLVPLGVNNRGSDNVPVPDQVPPAVAKVPIVILTWPDPKYGKLKLDSVNAAFGKKVLENEFVEIANNKNKKNKYLNETLNFCKAIPLRFFIKKSLLKKAL